MKKDNEVSEALISKRKSEHLQIVAERDVIGGRSTLLDNIRLMHQALPDLSFDEIDLSMEFFGKRLAAPLMIASMTGGVEYAGKLNRGLAKAAQQEGIAFAVGSQRIMLTRPEVEGDFRVREEIPDGVLLGNIGAVQLQEYPLARITDLVERIRADGICVHLNAAQELVQKEGHRDFRGLLDKIAELVDHLDGRVLVKETGAGMSPETLDKLAGTGVQYVDVSGSGGTSWTKVEMYRESNSDLRSVAETFAEWGIPTAFSVIAARQVMGTRTCVIASGGILTGLDMARAIVAGADMAAFARRALLAFLGRETQGVTELIGKFKRELRTAMLLLDCRDVESLKKAPKIYTGELRHWLAAYGWLQGEMK